MALRYERTPGIVGVGQRTFRDGAANEPLNVVARLALRIGAGAPTCEPAL